MESSGFLFLLGNGTCIWSVVLGVSSSYGSAQTTMQFRWGCVSNLIVFKETINALKLIYLESMWVDIIGQHHAMLEEPAFCSFIFALEHQ